ncbi:GMC family oxidoreductase N-terminal domain-containing protein [Nocardiopsis composta]
MAAARPGGRYADAHPARLAGGAERTIVRGRVGGGSGALNGGVFLRARPEDFAAFAAGGRDAWSYRSVLPVLAALEDDRDFTGPGHGRGGPVPVRRPDPLLPATEAFIDACRSAGHPEEPDKNAAGPPGVGRLPLNVVGGVRHSTALTHLAPAAGRPGLEVRGRTPVLRVELDRDGRAAGVLARPDGGAPEPVRARTVVLCAGALRTPSCSCSPASARRRCCAGSAPRCGRRPPGSAPGCRTTRWWCWAPAAHRRVRRAPRWRRPHCTCPTWRSCPTPRRSPS